MSYIVRKELSLSDTVNKVWTKEYSSISYQDASVAGLERLLARRNIVFVEKINEST